MPDSHPDRRLVGEAIGRRIHDAAHVHWQVYERRQTRKSILYFIDVEGSAKRFRLVYKVRRDAKAEQYFRYVSLIDDARRRLKEIGVQIAPVLAADGERQVVISMYLPGRSMPPLGWGQRVTLSLLKVYADIGAACFILDSLRPPMADEDLKLSLWDTFERHVRRAPIPARLSSLITHRGRALHTRATNKSRPFVLSHGDVTFSNIVLNDMGIGLIDVGFAPILPGAALYKMLHRIRFSGHLEPRHANEAVEAMLAGYGRSVPADAMEFNRLIGLLKTLAPISRRARFSPRRLRAFYELRTLAKLEARPAFPLYDP